jgi:hypothetical protein
MVTGRQSCIGTIGERQRRALTVPGDEQRPRHVRKRQGRPWPVPDGHERRRGRWPAHADASPHTNQDTGSGLSVDRGATAGPTPVRTALPLSPKTAARLPLPKKPMVAPPATVTSRMRVPLATATRTPPPVSANTTAFGSPGTEAAHGPARLEIGGLGAANTTADQAHDRAAGLSVGRNIGAACDQTGNVPVPVSTAVLTSAPLPTGATWLPPVSVKVAASAPLPTSGLVAAPVSVKALTSAPLPTSGLFPLPVSANVATSARSQSAHSGLFLSQRPSMRLHRCLSVRLSPLPSQRTCQRQPRANQGGYRVAGLTGGINICAARYPDRGCATGLVVGRGTSSRYIERNEACSDVGVSVPVLAAR